MAKTPRTKYITDNEGNKVLNENYRKDTRVGRSRPEQNKYHDKTLNPDYKERQTPHVKAHYAHGRLQKDGSVLLDPFIAWDSEGINAEDGSHHTILIANSEGKTLEKSCMTTLDWLDFLTEHARDVPHALHIMFSFSYDVNMLVVDVPRKGYSTNTETKKREYKPDSLEAFQAGDTIHYGQYELTYRNRKCLNIQKNYPRGDKKYWKVTKHAPGTKAYEREGAEKYSKRHLVSMQIYDVFGFFQVSFVKALKGYMGKDYAGLTFIEKMKNKRGDFAIQDSQEIKAYCLRECEMLVDLCNALRTSLMTAGLYLERWDGAGAASAELLKTHDIKAHMAETPQAVQIAARYAYAGGRIESIQYGNIPSDVRNSTTLAGTSPPLQSSPPKIWQYDIKSAYPHGMTLLPSLQNGVWKHSERKIDPSRLSPFTVYRVKWDFAEHLSQIYPFFFRQSNGSILYPECGEGWLWSPEVEAAIECHDGIKGFELLEAWSFYEHDASIRPFAFLTDLFAQRAIWKEEGNAAEKAAKLAMNSVYGKLCQKVGMRDPKTKQVQKPAYHQLEWAGWITSYTRSKAYKAAMCDPENVLALATDGVFCLHPLPLKEGTGLGDWGVQTFTSGTFVTSGVYFLDSIDEQGIITGAALMVRGFDKESAERAEELKREGKPYLPLTRERVLEAWNTNTSYTTMGGSQLAMWGKTLKCTSQRFVTLGTALSSDKIFPYWHTFRVIDRSLDIAVRSGKRRPIPQTLSRTAKKTDEQWGKENPSMRLFPTIAAPNDFYAFGIEAFSAMHDLPWSTTGADENAEKIDGVDHYEYCMEAADSTY